MGRNKMTEEEKKKQLKKKEDIIANEKSLKLEYTKKFNNNLYAYLQDWSKQKDKNGKKHTKDNMYNDLGINKSTFANYISKDSIGNLPKYEWLFSIKDYLDVPFSYLFGETKSITTKDIDVSVKYGLTDKSLATLKKYQSHLDNFDNVCYLYVINSLIENTELTKQLGKILIDKLSHKMNYEKYLKLEEFKNSESMQFYNFKLFKLFNSIDNHFETLLNDKQVPQELIEIAKQQPIMNEQRLKKYDKLLEEEK